MCLPASRMDWRLPRIRGFRHSDSPRFRVATFRKEATVRRVPWAREACVRQSGLCAADLASSWIRCNSLVLSDAIDANGSFTVDTARTDFPKEWRVILQVSVPAAALLGVDVVRREYRGVLARIIPLSGPPAPQPELIPLPCALENSILSCVLFEAPASGFQSSGRATGKRSKRNRASPALGRLGSMMCLTLDLPV